MEKTTGINAAEIGTARVGTSFTVFPLCLYKFTIYKGIKQSSINNFVLIFVKKYVATIWYNINCNFSKKFVSFLEVVTLIYRSR